MAVMLLPIALAGFLLLSPQDQVNFTGAGSCASSNCHGSVWPRTGGRIKQNEYQIWSTKDGHAKAYAVLLEPRSQQIARNLGISEPHTATLCLDCHTTNAPQQRQARTFEISDGVGCESCHGPASQWLGPHTTRDWTHQQSLSAGMNDTRDFDVRADTCLSCHLGNQEKTVNHQLIAAGHPDLVFELDTFSALMPRHWDEPEGDWQGLRRWAIGQAVSLRESMEQLAHRVEQPSWAGWPDFADFECFACHHNLVLPSERQARGYKGIAGIPPWNPSRYIVFRHAVTAISGGQRQQLEQLVENLKQHLQQPADNRLQIARTARQLADLTDSLISQWQAANLGEPMALQIMRAISGDAQNIAQSGIRSAEQATMSVDALFRSWRENTGKTNELLDAQIARLYEWLQSTSRYSPSEFATQLAKIQQVL
ncbi:MAG: multiheme c-type cytochrome [Acidobacteriota bacterium]